MKYIKTPVKARCNWGYYLIQEASGREVARVHIDHPTARQTSAELELVINTHNKLLAACKALMAWMGPPPIDPQSYDSQREDAWAMAQAAISEAEAEK